jgi:lipoprotein-anchoring transpeptidase ErfK/SrfK
MPQRKMSTVLAAIFAAGLVAGSVVNGPSAWADPEVNTDPGVIDAPPAQELPAPPAPPEPFGVPMPGDPAVPPPPGDPGAPQSMAAPTVIPAGTPAGQDPTPFVGDPPFVPPSFNPLNGSLVGVGKPIYINFARPIANRALAQSAVHISSVPPVPGKFYWTSDTQLRWRPLNFWPANTNVFIDAAGTKSTFHTGDALIATADNATHQLTITRNGTVEKTFPMSMGKTGHDTPNGTYYVLERFASIVMDSATYGVPSTSAQGYKLTVQDAVRIDNSGNFVHSAPWSVGDQGKRNVSHGCINISPANAQWFYDNFGTGDPVIVKNSVGSYTQPDGASDWQM